MFELIIVVVALPVAVRVGKIAWMVITEVEPIEGPPLWGIAVLCAPALIALYGLVRIIHWAWVTPIPVPSWFANVSP